MTIETSRESAQIIPFPVGGRRAVAARRDDASAMQTAVRVSGDAIGGAWYHEAAIQDSKRAGER